MGLTRALYDPEETMLLPPHRPIPVKTPPSAGLWPMFFGSEYQPEIGQYRLDIPFMPCTCM
jgi:hypothetical protein